jgi:hypothetical protein
VHDSGHDCPLVSIQDVERIDAASWTTSSRMHRPPARDRRRRAALLLGPQQAVDDPAAEADEGDRR